MKILFATNNPAKIEMYKELLEEKGIDILTIKDLGFKLDIDENGKDAIENAYIKAKAYYDSTKIPTVGIDDNLFIEELPDELQPGTHVRRVNGKELNDEEMIIHYTNLAKQYGGKLNAKWVYGIVVCSDNGIKKSSFSRDNFYFVDKPCEKRIVGYPLASIHVIPEINKYYAELTEEEKKQNRKDSTASDIVQFIINNIKE